MKINQNADYNHTQYKSVELVRAQVVDVFSNKTVTDFILLKIYTEP